MWIALTEEDLKSSMTAKERNSFGTAAADNTPSDRVPQILADLVEEVRGYIATHTQNSLSADRTLIPRSMRAQALAIARWRVLITVPAYQPGDARQLEYEKAVSYFEKVAKGQIRPEPADDAIANPVPEELRQPGVEVVTSQPSRTGRSRMNGL